MITTRSRSRGSVGSTTSAARISAPIGMPRRRGRVAARAESGAVAIVGGSGITSTRSIRPRTRSPSRVNANSRSTYAGTTGARRELLGPEAAQGRATGLEARLLVLAGDEALVRPGRLEGRDERLLGHHVAAGVAAVELGDGQVERGAVDDRVVRRDRDPHHVDVAVLERAGQVGVDLVEGEDERLGRVARSRQAAGDLRRGRLEGGEPLDGAGGAGRRRRAGRQVERLEDERRDAPGPLAAVVQGVGQHELVAGPRHADVEEPPLLLHVGVAAGEDAAQERVRDGELLAPPAGGEATVHESDEEDDRPLQPLRLVEGRDGDGVRVGVQVGGRRVVPGVDERLQVRREEDGAVVGEEVGLGPDDLEEAGDVRERLFGGHGFRLHEPGE